MMIRYSMLRATMAATPSKLETDLADARRSFNIQRRLGYDRLAVETAKRIRALSVMVTQSRAHANQLADQTNGSSNG